MEHQLCRDKFASHFETLSQSPEDLVFPTGLETAEWDDGCHLGWGVIALLLFFYWAFIHVSHLLCKI